MSIYACFGRGEEPPLIPLRTGARLPSRATQVAELCAAPARHMVAAEVELYHRLASWTASPPRLLSERNDISVVLVCVTIVEEMNGCNGVLARGACAGVTFLALVRVRAIGSGSLTLSTEEAAARRLGTVYAFAGAKLD